MRMKKKTWILTFESTTQAMAAEKYAMEQNLPVIATISTLGTLFGLLGTV